MTSVLERWLAELEPEGNLALAANLGRFPELRRAVIPRGLQARIEPESGIQRVGNRVAVELTLHLLSPRPETAAERERVGHLDLDIDPDENVLRIHTLDTPPALQRQGIGSEMMRELRDLACALELSRIELEAGKIGRWAWARFGFEFLTSDDQRRVLGAAARFARALGRDVDLSQITQPGDLAALTDPVGAEEVLRAGGPVIDGDTTTLGKALLLGPPTETNSWFGVLRL